MSLFLLLSQLKQLLKSLLRLDSNIIKSLLSLLKTAARLRIYIKVSSDKHQIIKDT